MNTETITTQSEEAKYAVGSRKVRFFFFDPFAEQVSVAGTFNNWNPTATPMTREGRRWVKELNLPFERYEYQFVIDGHWKPDPTAQATVFNPFGGLNSVLNVAPTNGNENN